MIIYSHLFNLHHTYIFSVLFPPKFSSQPLLPSNLPPATSLSPVPPALLHAPSCTHIIAALCGGGVVVVTQLHPHAKITSSQKVQSQRFPPPHRVNGVVEVAGVEMGNMKLKMSSILTNRRDWSPAPHHGDDQGGDAAGYQRQFGATTRQQHQHAFHTQEVPVKHSHSIAVERYRDSFSTQASPASSYADCMQFIAEGWCLHLNTSHVTRHTSHVTRHAAAQAVSLCHKL